MGQGAGESWWRKVRRHLSVAEQDGQLIIRPRWQPHALAFSVYGFFVAAALWTPWASPELHHLLRHHTSHVLLLCLFYFVLLVAPVVYARRLSLRNRTFVFDRRHDYVTCDDRVVCALSEVQSVRVGRPLGREVETKELGFLIHGRSEVSIEWNDLLGAGAEELGQAGQALSLYANVPLWAEGEWRDPSDPGAVPPPVVVPDPTRFIRTTPRGRLDR